MNASRHASRALAGLVVASIVATAPSFAFADSDRHHKKHKRHASVRHHDRDHRESRDRDRDDDRDRYRSRHRDKRGYYRHDYARPVYYGSSYCARPVYVAPVCSPPVVYVPQPVVYAPQPVVYAPANYGPYYDPGCDRNFSSFELYVSHVGERHAASILIRN